MPKVRADPVIGTTQGSPGLSTEGASDTRPPAEVTTTSRSTKEVATDSSTTSRSTKEIATNSSTTSRSTKEVATDSSKTATSVSSKDTVSRGTATGKSSDIDSASARKSKDQSTATGNNKLKEASGASLKPKAIKDNKTQEVQNKIMIGRVANEVMEHLQGKSTEKGKLPVTVYPQRRPEFMDTFKSFISSSDSQGNEGDGTESKEATAAEREKVLQAYRKKARGSEPFTWDMEEGSEVKGHRSNDRSLNESENSVEESDQTAQDNTENSDRLKRASSAASDDSSMATCSKGADSSDGSKNTEKHRSWRPGKQNVRHMYHNGKIWQIGHGAVSATPINVDEAVSEVDSASEVREGSQLLQNMKVKGPQIMQNVEVIEVRREHSKDSGSEYTSSSLETLKKSKQKVSDDKSAKWEIQKTKKGSISFQRSSMKKL